MKFLYKQHAEIRRTKNKQRQNKRTHMHRMDRKMSWILLLPVHYFQLLLLLPSMLILRFDSLKCKHKTWLKQKPWNILHSRIKNENRKRERKCERVRASLVTDNWQRHIAYGSSHSNRNILIPSRPSNVWRWYLVTNNIRSHSTASLTATHPLVHTCSLSLSLNWCI